VTLPIIVAGVRAAAGDWLAVGDDAYFTVRSRDVGTSHHPLLGAWSSGSADLAQPINNLGPLQLDMLAPFTKVAATGGTALGVMFWNVVWVCMIAWSVARAAGRASVAIAMVPVALLTWTMGSEMLITPTQHQFLVLPDLAFLTAAWAVAAGDGWSIVPLIGLGSLLAQTHLSYPILVAALTAGVVVHRRLAVRRSGSIDPRVWSTVAVVAVVCWSQTVVDQLAGRGNLVDAFAAPGGSQRVGFRHGLQVVADVLVSPAAVSRPGFRTVSFDLSGAWLQVVVLCGAIVVAGGMYHLAIHSGRRSRSAALAVVLTAVGAAIVNATLLPPSDFGVVGMNYRWLWSTSTFALVLAACALHRWRRDDRRLAWGAGAVLVAVVVANLPSAIELRDADQRRVNRERVRSVVEQMADVDLVGPVVVESGTTFFPDPYTYPVLQVLQDRDIEFRFDSDRHVARFGDDRRADGTETTRLTLLSHGDAEDRVGASSVVVYVDPSDIGDRVAPIDVIDPHAFAIVLTDVNDVTDD
jgi:hypothetical protein